MASAVSDNIAVDSTEKSLTEDVPVVAGVAVGDWVKPSGAKVDAVTSEVLGVVMRLGEDLGNGYGTKTQVLTEGFIESIDGTTLGIAANTPIYSDGDGTASDARPAGAAGTRISTVAKAVSTTRWKVGVQTYEKGAV